MAAARVLNPAVLTEFCKMRASPVSASVGRCGGRQLGRIKRDLFGPVNRVETNQIFHEELEKHQDKAIKKWGFDFRAGAPLNVESQFIWERVSFQESAYAPDVYTLTRATHMRSAPQQQQQQSNMRDALMDERAERENSFRIRSTSSSSTEADSCDDSLLDDAPIEPIVPMVRPGSLFKMPATVYVPAAAKAASRANHTRSSLQQLGKRQPKITEYMKERKRLIQAPKKMSPSKKMRLSDSGPDGVPHAPLRHSIVSHFALRK